MATQTTQIAIRFHIKISHILALLSIVLVLRRRGTSSSILAFIRWVMDQAHKSRKTPVVQSLVKLTPRVTELPAEILIQILSELDVKDILRLRQACTTFCKVSRAHQVWCNAYLRLSDLYEFPLPLHDHVTTLSASELEAYTLDWMRVDIGWRSTATCQPQRRVFPGRHEYVWKSQYYLVRGGRWLFSPRGSVVVLYDLDTKDGNIRSFVRTDDNLNPRMITKLTGYHPSTHPHSEFMLAATFKDSNGNPIGFTIWTIPTLLGSHLTISSEFSMNIPPVHCIEPVVTLHGDLLARALYPDSMPSYVEVFNWKQSTSLLHLKAAFVISGVARSLGILPGNRMLVIFHWSVQIFTLPEFRFISDMNSTPALAARTAYNLDLDALTLGWSSMRLRADGCAYLRFVSGYSLMKIFIPSSPELPPDVTTDAYEWDSGDRNIVNIMLSFKDILGIAVLANAGVDRYATAHASPMASFSIIPKAHGWRFLG
ncbi:hypothetical protein ONZ45_g11302 [Pleurotus djamor]|nr:hypothetical protein ONZ45_g11302 [Pleurotus djamor]